MLAGILFPFFSILLAELGDKTQLAVLLLASKTKRHFALLIGVLLAFFIVDGTAILTGSWVAGFVPFKTLKILSGIAFLVFGLWILKGHKEDSHENKKEPRNPFLAGFFLIFLAEWGDKTQIAAGLFAVKYPPLLVLIGTLSALALLSATAVYLGHRILSHIHPRTVSLAAGILFILMGVLALVF